MTAILKLKFELNWTLYRRFTQSSRQNIDIYLLDVNDATVDFRNWILFRDGEKQYRNLETFGARIAVSQQNCQFKHF